MLLNQKPSRKRSLFSSSNHQRRQQKKKLQLSRGMNNRRNLVYYTSNNVEITDVEDSNQESACPPGLNCMIVSSVVRVTLEPGDDPEIVTQTIEEGLQQSYQDGSFFENLPEDVVLCPPVDSAMPSSSPTVPSDDTTDPTPSPTPAKAPTSKPATTASATRWSTPAPSASSTSPPPTKPPTRSPSRCPPRLFAAFSSRCPALCLCRFRTSTALPVVSVCPSLDQTCSRVCPMSDSLVDPFFHLQVSTLTLSRDLTRKREGVTAPGCSLPGQRLFCPPCRHTRPRAGHTALFPFT